VGNEPNLKHITPTSVAILSRSDVWSIGVNAVRLLLFVVCCLLFVWCLVFGVCFWCVVFVILVCGIVNILFLFCRSIIAAVVGCCCRR
jgi:hypothetical protein